MGGRWDLLRLVRIPIFIGGALGCVLGALLGLAAGGVFNPLIFLVCYVTVALGDLSTHFSNDYFDAGHDRMAPKKMFGGSKLLVGRTDLMSPSLVAAKMLSLASIIMAVLAVTMGVSLIIIPLTLAANVLGWLYSLPPFRLAHRGLGEVAIGVGTGFGVPAAGYLAIRGSLDLGFFIISVPLMFYGIVLGLSLELTDVEADKAGGKMNLVVRFGWRAALRLAMVLCLASTVILVLFSSLALAMVSVIPLAAILLGNLLAVDSVSRLDRVATGCILSLFVFLIASLGTLVI